MFFSLCSISSFSKWFPLSTFMAAFMIQMHIPVIQNLQSMTFFQSLLECLSSTSAKRKLVLFHSHQIFFSVPSYTHQRARHHPCFLTLHHHSSPPPLHHQILPKCLLDLPTFPLTLSISLYPATTIFSQLLGLPLPPPTPLRIILLLLPDCHKLGFLKS